MHYNPNIQWHRKNKPDSASYWPIASIPVVSKLFEKVIPNIINIYINRNAVTFPNVQQKGFQLNLSCSTTAFALHETVLYYIERNSDVYLASLDQTAAFDFVRFVSFFSTALVSLPHFKVF